MSDDAPPTESFTAESAYASPLPEAAAPAPWEELFDEIAELDRAEREARLAELRASDPGLADRIARLLAADDTAQGFLDRSRLDPFHFADAEVESPPPDDDPEPPLTGSVVGSWRLLGLLGRGGMAEVYLAERTDPAFVQRAAVKVVKPGLDSRAIQQRFLREREILARLDHPNLAHFLDGGTATDGRLFFVLEWVDGEPITAYCRNNHVDLAGRLRLMQTCCQAVHSAHRRLVVHRDLKPDNILVTASGTVKLLDFGIAKLLGDDDRHDGLTLTQVDARLLTPAYAAPEQFLGEPISTVTDVYALGVLLFELITGSLPHRRHRRSLAAIANAVDSETVERPSALLRRPGSLRLARRVAGDLDLIVLRALHRDPARRYSSAQALADDLGSFLAGRPILARGDDLAYRARRFVGRHRAAVAASLIAFLALVGALGISLWETHVARREALRADAQTNQAERVKSFLVTMLRQSDPEVGEGATLTARELLERGAATIDRGLAGQPGLQADLFDAVAQLETNLGLLDPALRHARSALALRRKILLAGDVRIGRSLETLAAVRMTRGDVRAANRTYTSALTLLLAATGPDSPEVAMARRGIALAPPGPEAFASSVDLLRQALATFERLYGPDHPETLETLASLAYLLEVNQQYPEAEKTYRETIARLTRTAGPQSLKLAAVEADLAGLLDRLGRPAEARPLFERAIAAERSGLGPHHVRLAETLFSYAILMINQDSAVAKKALDEALAIYGPGRVESAQCLRFLGVAATADAHFAQAADYYSRAVQTFRKVLGDGNPETWRTYANLGYVHARLGHVAEGERELATAIERIEATAGAESYALRLPLEQLGEVLIGDGKARQALPLLRRDCALAFHLFGTREHHEVANAEVMLARALMETGEARDRREARQLLDGALAVLLRLYPTDAVRASALILSGRLALLEGDRECARRDLSTALPLLARYRLSEILTAEAKELLAKAERR
ncbi:MAG TPA: serine/threonine-protein kinase [Thermoanaerobaculia bacterium]